ncbi:hypothetical protein CDAR_488651 [Caerostris darwini]|uniref:Uncharacterized protein n=1 Tax=Caerostris darwini TaxID=1538125 RepID=A0AAV4S9H8_9ARAC|nr:hypothetical protein CDAR_488651 [Caerostris darwini]
MRYNPEQETTDIFSKKIARKKIHIQDTGFTIPEILVYFQLIRQLPPEYNLVQILHCLEDDNLIVQNVTEQFLTKYGRIELKHEREKKD